MVSAAALALAAPASAQVVSNGSPTSDVGPLGKDAITAVAQPFVSPISVYLQSFTFYLGNAFIGDQAFFTAAIYQFSNNATSGLALFTSDPFAGVGDPNADQPITIGSLTTAPLNIALSANTVYALILSSLDDNGASTPGAEDQVGLASTAMFGGLLATT
ncbi:MAG: hypothetical protein ACREPM_18460, partial [Gemmatimonadaceae bacterium]